MNELPFVNVSLDLCVKEKHLTNVLFFYVNKVYLQDFLFGCSSEFVSFVIHFLRGALCKKQKQEAADQQSKHQLLLNVAAD